MKNKSLKIIASTFLIFALVGISTVRIIFSKHSYMGGIQKVTFFSQIPSYRDKGFNELTYDGVNDYATTTKTMVGNTATSSYSDDGSSYVNELANIYDLGADTIVSSGFDIVGSFSGTKDYTGLYDKGYEDKTAVILDDDSLSKINPNAISVNYKSQDAGFIAGIVASLYTAYAIEEGYDVNPSIALWGGLAYSTVYDWLSGFEQSVNWFNYQILGFKLDGTRVDEENKVSSWNELKKDHNNSLELSSLNNSKEISSPKDETKLLKLNQPIKIDNAGDVVVDYTKAPPKGSDDGINFDPKTSFYTGGFGFDPNDQASGSNAAVKIKKINSDGHKDSIVFPVAGGQTMETLANLSSGSKTMVIGVDSDAEAISPNYGNNILGSATKNIELSANFATWYSQNKDATDKEKNDYTYNFNDGTSMSANEFINEWKIDNEDIKGAQFTGSFQNKGVGFVDNNKNKVGRLLNYFTKTNTWTTEDFLKKIVPDIFDMNNNTIEASSETFVIQDDGTFVPTHATNEMSEDYPWIPDWNGIYHN